MKKFFSLMMLCMVAMAANASKTVYLTPGSWAANDARFALYQYNSDTSAWTDFVADGDLLKAELGDEYTNIIICRMNPAATENSWDNKWNQTADLPAPVLDNQVYNITVTDGEWDGITLNSGINSENKRFLQNKDAKLWWGAANDWGTHASLLPHADYVTLVQQPNGAYTMDTQVSNGGNNHYFGGEWMDGAASDLTLAASGEYYTVQFTNGGNYFGSGNETLTNGTQNLNLTADATTDAALWSIFTEADMRATLQTATSAAPQDATWLIIDHTFGRNNRAVKDLGKDGVWKVSEDCTNYSLMGGNSDKHCAESYHSVFTITQTINGVPNGVYAMTAQGFYRQDGTDNDNLAEFFINGEVAPVPFKEGTENSMADACTSFEKGLYKINPIFVEVSDGTINLGVQNPYNANLWVIFDNFELTYYGSDASIDQIKNAALFAQVAELRAKAQTLVDQVEVQAVKQVLNAAIEATANVTTVEAANAAVETLNAAIDKAEASILAKSILPAMKALTESTNVYTEAAYEEYYGQWYQKYEAGTLTKIEAAALQNPNTVTGWRANATANTLLMSAWDETAYNWDSYHLNTWSVEGASDGTNFVVPFIEYWTGDGDSLGEKTLTATMENVAPGKYEVSAWVRVRGKNGFELPAQGITMQTNDGEEVNVVGERLSEQSNFYLANVSAVGEVGDNGILTIKFKVAAGNNISWLSFKNVKYAEYVEPSYYLVGTMTDWKVNAEYQLTKNEEAQGEEYTLTTDIAEGAELKVVKAKGENIVTWYPEGEDNNCTVNQAGNYTVYFRPNADGGDDWFNKVIYLNRNGEPVGIDAVNAIGENTVIFTLAGQRVKNAQKGIFIQNGKKVVIK